MIEVFDLYQNEHKTYFINHYLYRGVEQWQLVGLITRRSQVQILPPLPNFDTIMPVLYKTGIFILIDKPLMIYTTAQIHS